ncbi:MAG: OadG family transporter subunit [Kiritimatiellia bacterium]
MKLTGDGFTLLLLGQAMVFLFLGLMVLFINGSAAFVKRFLLREETELFEERHEQPAVAADDDTDLEIAVAAVAVQHLRACS